MNTHSHSHIQLQEQIERKEKSKKKEIRSPSLAEFDRFWKIYPRKENKGQAEKAWAKAIKLAEPDQIIEAVERTPWNEDKQFIPHPASWLNGKRWEDELPGMKPRKLTQAELDEQERKRIEHLMSLHRKAGHVSESH